MAVSAKPSLISHENVNIFYFYKEPMTSNTLVESINIDSNGRMPIKEMKARGIAGFFDQIDNDYLSLMKNQAI
ncbi:MAG: DUF3696 domain-containing protein [Chitinophagaceae bacterium]|nr:DUF3696 domain-containing protein [Chitinophagaceae bacterium]